MNPNIEEGSRGIGGEEELNRMEQRLLVLSEKEKNSAWKQLLDGISAHPESKDFSSFFRRLKIDLSTVFQAHSGSFGRRGVKFLEGSQSDLDRLKAVWGEREIGADYNPASRSITRYSADPKADFFVAIFSLSRFGTFQSFRKSDGSLANPLPSVVSHELIHDLQWWTETDTGSAKKAQTLYRPIIELQAHSGMSTFLQNENKTVDLIAVSCATNAVNTEQTRASIRANPMEYKPMMDIFDAMTNLRAVGWSEEQIAGLVREVGTVASYDEAKNKFMRGYNQNHVQAQVRRGLALAKVSSVEQLRENYFAGLRKQEERIKLIAEKIISNF